MKIVLSTLLCLCFAACAAPLKIEKLAAIDASSREFVLLTTTPWDADLRSAMHRQNFKVLKFASQKTIIREDKAVEQTEVYRKAGARYAISLSYDVIDRDIFSAKRKLDVVLEVADIRSNEVILVIKKGGWSHKVFDELAKELSAQWR